MGAEQEQGASPEFQTKAPPGTHGLWISSWSSESVLLLLEGGPGVPPWQCSLGVPATNLHMVKVQPLRASFLAGNPTGGREWELLLVVIREGAGRVGRVGCPSLLQSILHPRGLAQAGQAVPLAGLQELQHRWFFSVPISAGESWGRARCPKLCSAEEPRAPHPRGNHTALLPQQLLLLLPGPWPGSWIRFSSHLLDREGAWPPDLVQGRQSSLRGLGARALLLQQQRK